MQYDIVYLFAGKEQENMANAELWRMDGPLAAIVFSNPSLGNRPHCLLPHLSVATRGKAALLCISNGRR
jgi:hypothetical protein